MKAELLSTGDEIRSGALVDSNTAYIADKLEEIGIEVVRHHSCGDDMPVLTDILREISVRADIALVTGGLGPTTDDLSSEAAAKVAGVKLLLHEESLENIRAIFKKFQRPMTKSNEKQAYFPEGSTIFTNPVGTAPGFSIKIERCNFYFMPGVPFEMKKMLTDHVIPSIIQLQGDKHQHSIVKTISTIGLGESVVGEKVAAVMDKFKEIKLGLRATFPETLVKLYIRGDNKEKMEEILARATEWVKDQIGPNIISYDGTTMEQMLGSLLQSRAATLAIAESCTGGMISDLITSVPGSSGYFLFSGVTYSNEAKIRVLGVNPDTINRFGAVSEETVREMADAARRITGATYGLATSGIAGPDGGTAEKPVGTICVGLATPQGTAAKHWVSPYSRLSASYGRRQMNKRWFSMMAMEMLRRELIKQ
ncbi:MAG: competence/damage-inducible protein A [Spirochaetota bacterium]